PASRDDSWRLPVRNRRVAEASGKPGSWRQRTVRPLASVQRSTFTPPPLFDSPNGEECRPHLGSAQQSARGRGHNQKEVVGSRFHHRTAEFLRKVFLDDR